MAHSVIGARLTTSVALQISVAVAVCAAIARESRLFEYACGQRLSCCCQGALGWFYLKCIVVGVGSGHRPGGGQRIGWQGNELPVVQVGQLHATGAPVCLGLGDALGR